jgi:hypothetical protein
MENQETITITTNELRSLLIDSKYAVELAKDLAEEIGEDQSSSGIVGYKAGQIFRLLDGAYDKLYDAVEDHVPYIDEIEEDDNFKTYNEAPYGQK